MNRLSIIQRIKIITDYYKNGDSATATYRAVRWDYGLHNRPTTQAAFGKIVKKFEETGVVTDIEIDPLKILLFQVLSMTQISRFLVVLND